MSRESRRARQAGFSMIEALAGVTVTATIVASLAAVAGQWLPNWSRGFAGLQQVDLLTSDLQRIAEDVSAAEYVTPYGDAPGPLFDGRESSVAFVRSAVGPNASPHLEVVRYAEARDDRGVALARSRCAFVPTRKDDETRCAFREPISLVRAPLRVSFAYAGSDHVWRNQWIAQDSLPETVRITVGRGAGTPPAASTSVQIRVTPRGALKDKELDAAVNAPQPPPAPSPGSAKGAP